MDVCVAWKSWASNMNASEAATAACTLCYLWVRYMERFLWKLWPLCLLWDGKNVMVLVAPSTLCVFYFILMQSWDLWPFLDGFIMKWLYEYRIHIHTQSYFQLNFFVHSVLNKRPNINMPCLIWKWDCWKQEAVGMSGNILQRIIPWKTTLQHAIHWMQHSHAMGTLKVHYLCPYWLYCKIVYIHFCIIYWRKIKYDITSIEQALQDRFLMSAWLTRCLCAPTEGAMELLVTA